jgi:hypothetical protein
MEADVRNRARRAGYLRRALRPGLFVPAAALVPLNTSSCNLDAYAKLPKDWFVRPAC